jgi:acyl-CoA reductase-like NAD-dependent aldehyde dehydrogenase
MVASRRAYQMFINDEWLDSSSGRVLASVNPATGEVWAEVPEGNAEDIDRAVAAARKAFEDGPWRKMVPIERGKRLRRLGELIAESAAELARLESMDNGKAIRETLGVELAAIPNWYHYFGGLADKVQGETVPLGPDFLNYTVREPVGVVGAITPWNSPLLMYAMKLGPALAAGNTVVVKPAEQTPVTALELAKLIQRAEIPPGVVNVVPGYGESAGAALVRHPGVDKIAFTGETTTGQLICREMTGNLKRLTCELGGKSPNNGRRLRGGRSDVRRRVAATPARTNRRRIRRPPSRARAEDPRRGSSRSANAHRVAGVAGATAEGRGVRPHRKGGRSGAPLRRRTS